MLIPSDQLVLQQCFQKYLIYQLFRNQDKIITF